MRRNTTTQGIVAFKRTDWHWQDGTRYDWYNWVGNEPDTNVPCAKITPKGVWDDEYCSQRHKFICKIALQQPTKTGSTTTTTSLASSATTTKANNVHNSSTLTSIVPGSRVNPTDCLTTASINILSSRTTSPSQSDVTTRPEEDFSVSSDPPQNRQSEKRKSDVGLYISVAAGCIFDILAVVTVIVVLYRRMHTIKPTQSRGISLSSTMSPTTDEGELNAQDRARVGEYCHLNTSRNGEPVSYVNMANSGATNAETRDISDNGYVNTMDSAGVSYVNTSEPNTNVAGDPLQYETVTTCCVPTQLSSGDESFRQTTAAYEIMTSQTTPNEHNEQAGKYESLRNATDHDKHVYESANR